MTQKNSKPGHTIANQLRGFNEIVAKLPIEVRPSANESERPSEKPKIKPDNPHRR